MPVTKSAKGALNMSIRRRAENLRVEKKVKEALKAMRSAPTPTNLAKAYSAIDRAAKKYVIHKNKAARLKSSLAKLVKSTKKAVKKTKKK